MNSGAISTDGSLEVQTTGDIVNSGAIGGNNGVSALNSWTADRPKPKNNDGNANKPSDGGTKPAQPAEGAQP